MSAASRRAWLAAASFSLIAPLARAQVSSDWVADSLGCKVANPHPQPIESISWTGACKDGYAEGPGKVLWFSGGKPNGMTSGTFRRGKLAGKASVTLPHAVFQGSWLPGSRLDGEFLDNRLVGSGIITRPNGQKIVVIEIDGKLSAKNERWN